MQRSSSFRFFAMALTIAASLFVLFIPAARGQDDPFAPDAVLAQGNPPLTESMVTRYTNFTAWFYEIPFTQQQRERIRAILLRDWKKPQEIKNDMSWLTMAADFAKGTPDVREFVRCDLQARNLKAMRADKDPDAQWLVAAYDEAHPAIAAGNPPLTESMVSHYNAFTAWLLEIPLTQPLKDRQRAMLLEDWKKPKDLETDMKVLNWQLDMARYENGEVERRYVRSMVQPDMIKKMRADKGNPGAQSLVAAYDAAHPPIAAGNPPLTRQASDAWTELFCFVRNQSGAPHMDATQAVKDDFAHTLTENWTTYPPEKQKALSEMPQKWPLVLFAWVKGKDAERQKILAAWQPVVNPSPPADPQQAAASEAMARAYAFAKRDAKTVSDQELLQAAKDVDLVALEDRREGSFQALSNAVQWEDLARVMRAGKAAYLKRAQANTQAKADIVEEYYKTQVMKRALSRKIPTLTPDGRSLEVEPQVRF
jgi:hypothetical protein